MDPDFRARVLEERLDLDPSQILTFILTAYHKMFVMGEEPDYEPDASTSVAARAAGEGRHPLEVVMDLLAAEEGRGFIYFPIMNYTEGDLGDVHAMLTHENTTLGLGDGGAHCGILCDASFPTTMLTHWGRDRTRGPKLPLEWIIRKQTHDSARLVGLGDRGTLEPGMKADVNVIDFDRLRIRKPEIVHDLPAGGRRFVQKADGYEASIVSGEIAFREGVPTGALRGRLVRGARGAT